MKKLFKTHFNNGLVHYGIGVVSTPDSYLKGHIQLAKFHLNNPHIHTITSFEKLILNELPVVSLVFEGLDEEVRLKRDVLIDDDNCMNSKKSIDVSGERVKITPTLISKTFSKLLKSASGNIVNYIEKEYGLKNGFKDGMRYSNQHPINNSYVEYVGVLERV